MAEAEWEKAFGAAVSNGALSESTFEGLRDELAGATDVDAAMCDQLQSLAAGRLGDMLVVGTRARIANLQSRPELNGTTVKVLCFDPPSGRYAVLLHSGEQRSQQHLKLKRSSLELMVHSDETASMMTSCCAAESHQPSNVTDGEPDDEVSKAAAQATIAAMRDMDIERGLALARKAVSTAPHPHRLAHRNLASRSAPMGTQRTPVLRDGRARRSPRVQSVRLPSSRSQTCTTRRATLGAPSGSTWR
jgi:hypothetical protein